MRTLIYNKTGRKAGLMLAATLLLLGESLTPPALSDIHPEDGMMEQWINALQTHRGYQLLAQRVGLEETIEVIRLVETSRYPELVRALIQVESAWRPRVRSHRDARGLMQIRPIAAREVDPELNPDELYDPVTNIRVGIVILEEHMEYFMGYDHPKVWALTSYNRGRAGTFALGMSPPDTRYSRKVLELSEQM